MTSTGAFGVVQAHQMSLLGGRYDGPVCVLPAAEPRRVGIDLGQFHRSRDDPGYPGDVSPPTAISYDGNVGTR